jgi:hypothetical protein
VRGAYSTVIRAHNVPMKYRRVSIIIIITQRSRARTRGETTSLSAAKYYRECNQLYPLGWESSLLERESSRELERRDETSVAGHARDRFRLILYSITRTSLGDDGWKAALMAIIRFKSNILRKDEPGRAPLNDVGR